MVYSAGQFPYEYFLPFIEAFGNVTVIGRGRTLPADADIEKLNICNGPDIRFELTSCINSVKGLIGNYAKVDRRIAALVASHDAVIIRAVSDLGWVAYKHARRLNKPIAMEMSACTWDSTWHHGSPYGRIYAPVRFMRDRIITRNADFALYVSQNFLQTKYPPREDAHVAAASNVRIKETPAKVLEERLNRIKTHKTRDPQVIGLIGTLGHKLKGVHTALAAMRRIEAAQPGRFHFRVLGPGDASPYRALVEKWGLTHCVYFDGTLQTGAKVLEWLDNIDIYIQPSFQEGVPRATVEAMSRACPAIGSTAGGIPELLPDEWLHRPGDERQLQALLERMLSSPEAQEKAARQNFEHAKGFTAEKLMPIRMNFWREFREYAEDRKKNLLGAEKTGASPRRIKARQSA